MSGRKKASEQAIMTQLAICTISLPPPRCQNAQGSGPIVRRHRPSTRMPLSSVPYRKLGLQKLS